VWAHFSLKDACLWFEQFKFLVFALRAISYVLLVSAKNDRTVGGFKGWINCLAKVF